MMTTSRSGKLKIRNWEKWQSYRKDRGQPPWIKIHRCVMRNVEWVGLSDAERGQLVAIWLLAADNNGEIPDDPAIIRKFCFLDNDPNINKLIELGFILPPCGHGDANVTPTRRQSDQPEENRDRIEENRIDTIVSYCSERSGDNSEPQPEMLLEIPLIKKDGMFSVSLADIDEWQDTFPGIDAMAEVKKYRQWAKDNPAKRKTAGGIRKSITHWLSKAQDQGRGVKGAAQPPPGNPQDSMENKTAWLRSQTKETLEKLAQNGNIAAFNVLKERGEAVPLEAV